MEFRLESELEKTTIPYLESQKLKFCWQVPIGNRVIDLAAIDTKGNLIGFEYKLHNWKKALLQAKNNSNGFDYVYIFLPQKDFRKDLSEFAKIFGVGVLLLGTDHSVAKLVPAQKNNSKWIPKSQYIKNYILERGAK